MLATDAAESMSWLEGGADETGRRGGASGGGGRTGGSASGLKMLLSDFIPSMSSSCPSAALGTISDRNSKSSDDRASELLGLDALRELRLREKRPRNLETAEGGGVGP